MKRVLVSQTNKNPLRHQHKPYIASIRNGHQHVINMTREPSYPHYAHRDSMLNHPHMQIFSNMLKKAKAKTMYPLTTILIN